MADGEDRHRAEDLFLELANKDGDEIYTAQTPAERSSSRAFHNKHHSVPNVDAIPSSPPDDRPRSSGHMFASETLHSHSTSPTLHRLAERLDTYDREDDSPITTGTVRHSRPKRYSSVVERSMTPNGYTNDGNRTPFASRFEQRRQSFGLNSRLSALTAMRHDSLDESPAETSERKPSLPDSASVDSQTAASTVWDELDDLKSRIKKLEFTGKAQPAPNVVGNGEVGERPRTATTAPTTIDSSPKQTKSVVEALTPSSGTKQNLAEVHPLLQAALAKTKPLIPPQLYRSLQSTATDALQLAAMTAGTNAHRNNSSSVSTVAGLSASDRQIKRKADSMCRNLTDLCLALCDGKEERSQLLTSSTQQSPLLHSSPPRRYTRGSFGGDDAIVPNLAHRPMSRLEARRSTILGINPGKDAPVEPRSSLENLLQAESMTSRLARSSPGNQHIPRAGSLLRGVRHDFVQDEEDSTIRPTSRAMTEYGSLRARGHGSREFNFPSSNNTSSRLRDSFSLRREQIGDPIRPLARVSSLESHRARAQADAAIAVTGANSGRPSFMERSRRQASISGGEIFSRLSRRTDVPARSNSISHRRSLIMD